MLTLSRRMDTDKPIETASSTMNSYVPDADADPVAAIVRCVVQGARQHGEGLQAGVRGQAEPTVQLARGARAKDGRVVRERLGLHRVVPEGVSP